MPNHLHDPQKIKGVLGIKPQNQSGDGTVSGASWIDRQGFDALKLSGIFGAATGSPSACSVTFRVQDATDSSGTGAATFADATVASGLAAGIENANIDLSGANQYIRVQAIVAFTGGSTPTVDVGAVASLCGAHTLPTSD